jgi:hypothetical protein
MRAVPGVVVPRSLAQAGLLAAVLAVVTCAVTPLGLAALLLVVVAALGHLGQRSASVGAERDRAAATAGQ